MPTRITVRYLGSEVGKKVARPDTKGEVLELAAKRLNLSTPASRIFAASPTSGLYCTIGRRLCRPTGDVDGTQRLEGTCEPRTRTSTENGAFHPHCCTGGIGSIPHGTGPLDRLALPWLRLYILFLSHPVSFPFLFSLQHPLFSSLFSRGNHQIFRALSRV